MFFVSTTTLTKSWKVVKVGRWLSTNARAALEKGRQVQLLYLYSWFKTNFVSKACEQKLVNKSLWTKKKKNFIALFYGWGSTASRLQPLQGDSLLFAIQFPEIPGTHFIDFGRMKGWVNLGATQWFWTRDSWIGNPAPSILASQLNLNLWPDVCVDLSILKLDYNLLVNLNWVAMVRKVCRFTDHILQLSLIRTNLFWLAFLAI